MIEWPDEWTIVSNEKGVWVRHESSSEAWRLVSTTSLRDHDDGLAQTYRQLHGCDDTDG